MDTEANGEPAVAAVSVEGAVTVDPENVKQAAQVKEPNGELEVRVEGANAADPVDLKPAAQVIESTSNVTDGLEQGGAKENGPVNGVAPNANGSEDTPNTQGAVKPDSAVIEQKEDGSKLPNSDSCPPASTSIEKPTAEGTNKEADIPKSPEKTDDKESKQDTAESPKPKSPTKSPGKEKETTKSKVVENGKDKKPATPRKQVSSRLFSPTASSLSKHSDKMETPRRGQTVKSTSKDKPNTTATRPRPISASPAKTNKPNTPRSRPVSAPPSNKKVPSTTDKKQQPRSTTPRQTTTPKIPRERTSGAGTRRPASTTSTTTARVSSAPTSRRTANQPTTPRTSTPRRPVTTTSSPTRTTSATTRRTTTTTSGPQTRSTPSGTAKRMTTTVKTRTVLKDGVPVTSSSTRSIRTTTQARPASGRTRPDSGTTRTVTSSTRTKHGSPVKSSPGHRPAMLNLSPKGSVTPPMASPRSSHSPPGRYAVIEHHDACRADTVLNRLSEFRANKQFTDLILHVKGTEIICHRMVMAACCNYFRETLSNAFTAKTDIIDIRGVQASILNVIVDYAYEGKLSVPKRIVPSLFEGAELFQIDTLASACKSFITYGESPPTPKSPGKHNGTHKGADTGDQSSSEKKDNLEENKEASDKFHYCDPHHNSKLLHTLHEFRPVNAFVDVVLKSGHEVLPCHRSLLAASSEHFMLWFTEKLKSDQVPIPEIKPDILRKLVDFAYTSKFAVTERELYRFFDGARKLQMMDAWKGCLSLMSRNLGVQNCLRTLKAAETAGQGDLAARARAFALEHFIEACQYDYFPHISKERLIDLISSDDLHVPKEEMVYEAVVSWVRYDLENRKSVLSDVLAQIRFNFMSESYITEIIFDDDMICMNKELKEKIEQLKNTENKPRKYEGSVFSK